MKNWRLNFGWRTKRELLYRLWWGGSSSVQLSFDLLNFAEEVIVSPGDGKTFIRNPQSERMLTRLAKELVDLDIDR